MFNTADKLSRNVESGSAGGAITPPIFLDMRKKVAFSTPNIFRLQEEHAQKVISTPNILQLPTGLLRTLDPNLEMQTTFLST